MRRTHFLKSHQKTSVFDVFFTLHGEMRAPTRVCARVGA
jgi:hypothetical protein